MNGLYLQYEELWMESTIRRDGKKVNVLYIVDRNHQKSVIAVDHFKEFWRHLVDGGYNGEIVIQEEEIIVWNWKKGKLKTKNLSKITTYIRWTRALSTISSRQNQSSASLKLRNYVFTKTWKLAIAISENKYKEIVGVPC